MLVPYLLWRYCATKSASSLRQKGTVCPIPCSLASCTGCGLSYLSHIRFGSVYIDGGLFLASSEEIHQPVGAVRSHDNAGESELVLNVLVWILSNKVDVDRLNMICKGKRAEKIETWENR